MKSAGVIRQLICAIDAKLKAKTVSLASGVALLGQGFCAEQGTSREGSSTDSSVGSLRCLAGILDSANKTTGYADSTVTDAVQRLCDGYAEGKKRYSFGVLADLHIQYDTGLGDFRRALEYLKKRVPFTCVCGDLVSYASAENMAQYKAYVDAYAGDMPLYACAGNHETYPQQGVASVLDEGLWTETTGKKPYFSFEYQGDVFLFLSLQTETTFADGGLAWLEEMLEANKDKRCFVFQHLHDPEDDTADPSHKYSDMLAHTQGRAFLALMRQYRNAIWFHGHTHLTFQSEQYPVGEVLGYRSVHIPSLSGPRFYNAATDTLDNYYFDENGTQIWGSVLAEGYIVDVYADKILLRGINFAAGSHRDRVEPMADEFYALPTN